MGHNERGTSLSELAGANFLFEARGNGSRTGGGFRGACGPAEVLANVTPKALQRSAARPDGLPSRRLATLRPRGSVSAAHWDTAVSETAAHTTCDGENKAHHGIPVAFSLHSHRIMGAKTVLSRHFTHL